MTNALSTFPRCTLDPRCEYAAGHTCECTPIEIGKHVAKLRSRHHANAYRRRIEAILERVEATWLDDLVESSSEEAFSPLLIVGWTSVSPSVSYGTPRVASTWHRDRFCKLNRASGVLVPVLYLEIGRSRPCRGCGKLTDTEKNGVRIGYRRLRDLQLAATEGLCWGGKRGVCGQDVEPGKTSCAQHKALLTEACFEGRHGECDKVLATRTRQHDGSTYNVPCECWVCH